VVPWLHTVTLTVNGCPGRMLAGPLTDWTMKSGSYPTPMTLLARVLFVSISSSV
jgi:hypothetical protein